MTGDHAEPLEDAIGRLVVRVRAAAPDGAPVDPAVGELLEALTAIRLARDRLAGRIEALEAFERRLVPLPATIEALIDRLRTVEDRAGALEARIKPLETWRGTFEAGARDSRERLTRLKESHADIQARIVALEAPPAPAPWWRRVWPRAAPPVTRGRRRGKP